MTIPEAAQLVLQAGALAESGNIYVLDMASRSRSWILPSSSSAFTAMSRA